MCQDIWKKTQHFFRKRRGDIYNLKQETSLIYSEFVWIPGIFSLNSLHTSAKVEEGFLKNDNQYSPNSFVFALKYAQSYGMAFLLY